MKAAAETTLTIAADPKRLGARIGITAVLHTWGSAMTHHPHVHMIVPGGGLSDDGSRWISSPSNFLVHVNVLARLFRGKLLAMLTQAHVEGRLKFFNTHAQLADKRVFKRFLAPLRRIKWVVYCKDPFAGPEQVLRYLSRYTHRVAISNRRLVAADDGGVAFRWKDYRIDGPGRWKTMTLDAARVHPPFPHARAAERLPSHPPLRPVRQRQSCREHRQGARAARRDTPAESPISPAHCRVLAPAAAGACSSSRPSHPAASPSTGRTRRRQWSGSTPHDDERMVRPPKPCPGSQLVLHRRCWRLLRCRKSPPIRHAGQTTEQVPRKIQPPQSSSLVFDHPCSWPQPAPSTVPSSEAKSP